MIQALYCQVGFSLLVLRAVDLSHTGKVAREICHWIKPEHFPEICVGQIVLSSHEVKNGKSNLWFSQQTWLLESRMDSVSRVLQAQEAVLFSDKQTFIQNT